MTIALEDHYFASIAKIADAMADLEGKLRADAVKGGLDNAEKFARDSTHVLLRYAKARSNKIKGRGYWLENRADISAIDDPFDDRFR